jgi:pimeloyl-ACP methyl ester carboxylesterase
MPWITAVLATSLLFADDLPRRGALGVPLSPVTPDVAQSLSLPAGQGIVAGAPVPGLTAANAGIKTGDIIVQVNGRPAQAQGFSAWVRTLETGSRVTFRVMRDGQTVELAAPLTEKPRDPGNENFKVEYSSVNSHGDRMRTIITRPTAAGKHPGVLFIQGFSPVSYDYTLATAKGDVTTLDGPILFTLANSNFVTMRVEKPGVGDSEGGPFETMDFLTELDIYEQAMEQLRQQPNVDPDNIFIFGHSMGGSFGPVVASKYPTRGVVVYGCAGRTWFEYLMDTIRYQGLVAGQSYVQADQEARLGARIMALAMIERKSAEEIKASHPDLAPLVDAYFPGGMFNGKTLEFWRQLNDLNHAEYWVKTNAPVLAVRGASDFVTYDIDHKTIADTVNQVRPGQGESMVLPNSDHLFHAFATEQESMSSFQRGQFNNDFSKVMIDWFRKIMATPRP